MYSAACSAVKSATKNKGVCVVVLRVGDAWLVGVGKRVPLMGSSVFDWSLLMHGSLDRLKAYTLLLLEIER